MTEITLEQLSAEIEVRPVSSLNVVSLADFLQMKLPPREYILSPWLPMQGLAMIFAMRGVGKTHVGLNIAYAVASGGGFS